MAENFPQSGSASGSGDAPSWPLSRIILLGLLAVAVGLLVFDKVGGQLAQRRAYKKLARETNLGRGDQEEADDAEAPKGPVKFVSAAEVHGWLGQPAETEDKPAALGVSSEFIETYRYPGVFNRYLVRVQYNVRHKPQEAGGGVDDENTTVKGFVLVTKGPFGDSEEQANAPAGGVPAAPAAPASNPKANPSPRQGFDPTKQGESKGPSDPKSGTSPARQ